MCANAYWSSQETPRETEEPGTQSEQHCERVLRKSENAWGKTLTGKETWMAGEDTGHIYAAQWDSTYMLSWAGRRAWAPLLHPSKGGVAFSWPGSSHLRAPACLHLIEGMSAQPLRCFLFYYCFYFNPCSVQRKKKITFLVNKVGHLKQLTLPSSPSNCGCAFDVDDWVRNSNVI